MTAPIITAHFRLTRDTDAYGERLFVDQKQYNAIHLLQPFNAWAAQHFQPEDNERKLCVILEYAFEKGYKAAQADLRKALGIHD